MSDSKHIIPGPSVVCRLAAKLDVSPISDLIGAKDADTFVWTIYAGNALMTLESTDLIKVTKK
jgi:electron transfer flavoprotein alpha subunit